MALFQPQLSSQPQAAKVGVASNAAQTQALNQATDALVGGIGMVELNDLQTQFDEIKQARATGGDRNNLMTQARVLLANHKADMPGLAKHADKMFSGAFGGGGAGGGAGGLFSATPAEKGAEAAQMKVAEYAATNQVSMNVAQERLALNDMAKAFESQSGISKYNAQEANKITEQAHQSNLNNSSVFLIDQLNSEVTTQGGLSAQWMAGSKLGIRDAAVKMKNSIRNNAFRDDGSLAITQGELSRRIQDVDTWMNSQSTLVDEFAKSKIDKAMLTDMNNENSLVFSRNFPMVSAVSGINPQLGKEFFSMMTTDDETKRSWIKSKPEISALLANKDEYAKNFSKGVEKLTIISDDPISQQEAQSVGAGITNGSPTVMPFFMEEAASNPSSAANLQQVAYWSPEVLSKLTTPSMRFMLNSDWQKHKPALDSTVLGAANSFKSNYIAINGVVPTGINITVMTSDATGREELVVRSEHGIDSLMGSINMNKTVNDMYRVLQQNPAYLKDLGTKAGNPDVTPEAYLSMILGGEKTVSPNVSTATKFEKNQPAAFGQPATPPSGDNAAGIQRLNDLVKSDLAGAKQWLKDDFKIVTDILGITPEEAEAAAPVEPAAATPVDATPKQGTVMDGYRFKGGDPALEANWELQ